MVKSRGFKKRGPIDYVFLIIVAVLIFWGLVTVGTVSFPIALQNYGSPWYYLWHQSIMLGVGAMFAVICFKFPLKTLRKCSSWFFLFNLLLISLVFIPRVGVEIGGAKRWLNLGGFLFQPSELLKITFLLYLAAWLSQRKEVGKKKKLTLLDGGKAAYLTGFTQLFLPFLFIVGVLFCLLILEPDMSTLAIICISGLVMYFIASTPWWHTPLIMALGAGGAYLLIKIAPYRLARLLIFLNPAKDPLGIGYQLRQSLIAVGSGKLLGIGGGLGLGMSRQKLGFLPYPMTDSIFAIIGEELGFVGGIVLVLLFLALFFRVLKIAERNEKDSFERLLATGIGLWLCFQAWFNIGGMLGVLPMGGVPLPFFSYGGSHLITELAAVGLLLNISRSRNI